MAKDCILVVEDEDDIREMIGYNLLKAGYQVAAASTGEEALELLESRPPDLVLLDIMLPGVDGMEVCRRMKGEERLKSIPVIMLTAKGEEADVVEGLNLGADDYITKPFSPKVLLARMQAVLRRINADCGQMKDEVVKIHNLTIDNTRHKVFVKGKEADLTPTEFRLLEFLARRPGWVFTREQILDGVHGESYAITDRAVDVQIVGLRKKLFSAGKYIETVRGVGYRFKE